MLHEKSVLSWGLKTKKEDPETNAMTKKSAGDAGVGKKTEQNHSSAAYWAFSR